MNTVVAILFVAYAMPGRMPDVYHRIEEPSLEACWKDAREFVERGVPDAVREQGAVGLYAGCRVSSERTVDD